MNEGELEIKQEGVTTYSRGGQLLAVHYMDMESRHHVFYKTVEMGQEEVAEMIKNGKISLPIKKEKTKE